MATWPTLNQAMEKQTPLLFVGVESYGHFLPPVMIYTYTKTDQKSQYI